MEIPDKGVEQVKFELYDDKVAQITNYANGFNTFSFTGFSKSEKRIFMSLLTLIHKSTTPQIIIDYDYFKKTANINPSSKTLGRQIIRSTIKKMMLFSLDEVFTHKTEDDFFWFTGSSVNVDDNQTTIDINAKYYDYIKEVIGYTQLSLVIHNSFEGDYTGDIYKFFRQFSSTGYWIVKVEDFRNYLGIPKSYTTNKIIKTIINKSIEELQPYYSNEICFTPYYQKKQVGEKGRKRIVRFRFDFPIEIKENSNKYIDNKFDEKKSNNSKSNIPEWSNPDYVETTSEEEQKRFQEEINKRLERMRKNNENN